MKKLLFLLFLLMPFVLFSQLDLGKTKSQIKAKHSASPCMEEERTLMFCSSDGNMIGYVFTNNRCESIQFWTAYSSKYIADIELEKAINSFARENNETPMRKGGMTSFTKGNGVGVTFSVMEYNNTNYVRQIFQAY